MTITVFGDNTGDDVAGCEDAYIDQSNATTNYGSNNAAKVQKFGASDHKHHLVRFTGLNTTNIPSGDSVDAATFGIYFNNANDSHSETHTLYPLLQAWVEGQVTWDDYATATAWNTGGAQGAGTDHEATSSCDISLTTATQEYKIGTFTAAGRQAIKDQSDGTDAKEGWMVERTDGSADANYVNYRSNDYADGLSPYLSVDHSTGATLKTASDSSVLTIGEVSSVAVIGAATKASSDSVVIQADQDDVGEFFFEYNDAVDVATSESAIVTSAGATVKAGSDDLDIALDDVGVLSITGTLSMTATDSMALLLADSGVVSFDAEPPGVGRGGRLMTISMGNTMR